MPSVPFNSVILRHASLCVTAFWNKSAVSFNSIMRGTVCRQHITTIDMDYSSRIGYFLSLQPWDVGAAAACKSLELGDFKSHSSRADASSWLRDKCNDYIKVRIWGVILQVMAKPLWMILSLVLTDIKKWLKLCWPDFKAILRCKAENEGRWRFELAAWRSRKLLALFDAFSDGFATRGRLFGLISANASIVYTAALHWKTNFGGLLAKSHLPLSWLFQV